KGSPHPPGHLPTVVHVLSDQAVVDLLDALELVRTQGRERCSCDVLPRLLGAASSRNDGADTRLVDDPAQRELRQLHARVNESLKLARGLHADFEWDARKRLADIERLAVTVEVAMVGWPEDSVFVVAAR